jgi:mRNA capping enzyme, C-terminal domain
MGTVCILSPHSPCPGLTGIAVCRMKVSGEHFEDRIVEVHWDSTVEGWKMMRFRDDKPAGNHIKTVESVIQSIRDGVEKETVRATHHTHGPALF